MHPSPLTVFLVLLYEEILQYIQKKLGMESEREGF
jgi:hypothetical protein